MESSTQSFKLGQRVHSSTDTRRIGTVKYTGPVEGYSGTWVGVDWDDGNGKHDGSINGLRYFQARSELSGSFVRPGNLSAGITLLQAVEIRYRGQSTKEEEEGMYVFSASNHKVFVELLGKEKVEDKLSRLEELTGASLFYLGVSSAGSPTDIGATLPNLKELDLTGNLLTEWKDVGIICEHLPALLVLNLSHNVMSHDIIDLPELRNIRTLVLNNTGLSWTQIEVLKPLLPVIEELHLMGNGITTIKPASSSSFVQGFGSLRLLNFDDNCITDWNEILKLSMLRSLEQLHLNKNNLDCISYPSDDTVSRLVRGPKSYEKNPRPFEKLHCLLVGGNNIKDLVSIDSFNLFPNLVDIRLSGNPIADPGHGGMPRFVLIARLAKVKILNGSEVSPRERKESEIRYVRLVMTNLHGNLDEIKQLHPRFTKLKEFHGIEDEKPSAATIGPQKMASGLLSVNLKCVAASAGEKPPLTKKLPAATSIGKLKILCESLFKLRSNKTKLFIEEEGSPLPTLLNDEMSTLIDVGISNDSTVLIDEEG